MALRHVLLKLQADFAAPAAGRLGHHSGGTTAPSLGCSCQARLIGSTQRPGAEQEAQTAGQPQNGEPGQERGPEPPPVQPDLVAQVVGQEQMSSHDLHKAQLQDVRQQFQRFPGDCGSTEVQVAALTQKIRWMTQHMRAHHKDYHSRRGLEGWLSQRRKLLQYLRRTRFDTYAVLISRLGLRDSFAQQDRYSVRRKR